MLLTGDSKGPLQDISGGLPSEIHLARHAMYKALSLAYLYPGDIDWNEYTGILPDILMDVGRALDIPMDKDEIKSFKKLLSSLDKEVLMAEFTALFINNPLDSLISPYESVYLQGNVMGESAKEVNSLYESYGLKRQSNHEWLLPDHISLEFDFMAHLIRIFVEEERPTLDEQRDFFKTHLKNWVWHFLDDIKKGSSMPYFHKIADIAERFLSIEKVYFS